MNERVMSYHVSTCGSDAAAAAVVVRSVTTFMSVQEG